ncbi:MAG: aldo/keto reductase [Thermoplasmata archaeon]
MPVLGLGVWKTPAGAATIEAVRTALQAGYRLVDTATLYGNEKDVGQAIASAGIPRDRLFVTTKVWNADQGFAPTLAAFERSHAALGGAPVDLYLIHWPVPERRLETWKALAQLYREGRCRAIGVSNFNVRHLEELLSVTDIVPAVNQVEFSPFLVQRGLLDYCRARGIQLEAYAPLTRGHRLDHPVIAGIATSHGRSPAQVVLRWALQHDVIVIPKTVREARMKENAGALDFALPAAEMAQLDGLDEGYRTTTDPDTFA